MGKEVKTLATKKLLWTLALLLVMLFLGAVLYSQTEHWSFLDGVYFCFVTFATIGFGDLVPNKGERRAPGGGRGGGGGKRRGGKGGKGELPVKRSGGTRRTFLF